MVCRRRAKHSFHRCLLVSYSQSLVHALHYHTQWVDQAEREDLHNVGMLQRSVPLGFFPTKTLGEYHVYHIWGIRAGLDTCSSKMMMLSAREGQIEYQIKPLRL